MIILFILCYNVFGGKVHNVINNILGRISVILAERTVALVTSGGRLCTLVGVACRLSMLSTFSTFANVLFQYKSPRAEGAKTDPPPGYTYEGTQTTA